MARSLRFTQEQLSGISSKAPTKKEVGAAKKPVSAAPSGGCLQELLDAPKKISQKGMNKTEEAFARVLQDALEKGEIKRWEFESVSLKIGPNTRYNPDFLVVVGDDYHWQFIETKGFLRDDAAVKFKACVEKYPECSFMMVKRKKGHPGQWEVIYNVPSKLRSDKKTTLDPTKKGRKRKS